VTGSRGAPAYREIVLEHFRHPRNRGPLPKPDVSLEGANPLCGDRVRVELRVVDERIADAAFTADACVLCIASASLVTEHVRGMRAADAVELRDAIAFELVGGSVPAARQRCATLPLDTLRRGLVHFDERSRAQPTPER
jgi:nitrogen fixation NifU-like protein